MLPSKYNRKTGIANCLLTPPPQLCVTGVVSNHCWLLIVFFFEAELSVELQKPGAAQDNHLFTADHEIQYSMREWGRGEAAALVALTDSFNFQRVSILIASPCADETK